MIALVVILAAFALIEALAIAVLGATYREQGNALHDVLEQRDAAQQEVKVLTDAIARGNRTPILREETRRPLEKSEAYWDGRPQVVSVTTV